MTGISKTPRISISKKRYADIEKELKNKFGEDVYNASTPKSKIKKNKNKKAYGTTLEDMLKGK